MTASGKRNALWAVVILVAGSALAYTLLTARPAPQPAVMPEAALPVVDVVAARPGPRTLEVSTQGTVRPVREIQLVSRVGGIVESVAPSFAEGGFFRAGDTLLKMEDVDYRLALARVKSQVAAARQRVAEERGRALQAKREWRDLGSQEANDLFLRKPQLAAAEAALAAAEADLEAARLDLARTEISAPFDGRISQRHVDLGQYVSPATPVATVYDTARVQVRLPLTDRQVALLDLPLSYSEANPDRDAGALVLLSAQFGGQQWRWQGHVVRTEASIDVDSRMLYAVAEVEQPFARQPGSERPPLAPGLFVDALIRGREMEAVAALPRSALRSDDRVMLVGSGDRTELRQVRVLKSTPREVWLQGLEAGERVVVGESPVSVAGMRVEVNARADLAGAEL